MSTFENRTYLSLVIPVHNEAENICSLVSEVEDTFSSIPGPCEVIWVDDSSTDSTLRTLLELSKNNSRHRIISLAKNSGQSTAVLAGIQRSTSQLIATLDGDGQNDPGDIPALLQMLQDRDLLLAQGVRVKRRDSRVRRISSGIANGVRNFLLGVKLHDVGCAVRVFKREALDGLPGFKGFHRFLPVMVTLRYPSRVAELPVHHRPRIHGKSHYGVWNRIWVGLFDLLGILWIKCRGAVPIISYDSKFDPVKPVQGRCRERDLHHRADWTGIL